MLNIGYHISLTNGFLAVGEEALRAGANTFAFFTRNPRGGKAKAVDPEEAAALVRLLESNDFAKLVAHAPYTLNTCSDKANVREFARMATPPAKGSSPEAVYIELLFIIRSAFSISCSL